MKKILIILFIILTSNSIESQVNNGKIIYKVVQSIDKNNVLDKMYLSMSKNYEHIAGELQFSLIFNKESAIFYLEDKLYSDKYLAENVQTKAGYFGRVQQAKDYCITENLEEDFGQFLVKRKYPKWELLKETKKIGDFLCYKATFTKVTTYKKKIFKREYIAWYTPKIPMPYGPSEFGGLPGLILELQGKGFTYGVAKIELNKNIKLPELKKLELITEEELEERAKEDEKRWRGKD